MHINQKEIYYVCFNVYHTLMVVFEDMNQEMKLYKKILVPYIKKDNNGR